MYGFPLGFLWVFFAGGGVADLAGFAGMRQFSLTHSRVRDWRWGKWGVPGDGMVR
jgi:hypothetical protein